MATLKLMVKYSTYKTAFSICAYIQTSSCLGFLNNNNSYYKKKPYGRICNVFSTMTIRHHNNKGIIGSYTDLFLL